MRSVLRIPHNFVDVVSKMQHKVELICLCAMFVPSGTRTLYAFFEPQLRVCDENALMTFEAIALALSPDSDPAEAQQSLERAGFRKVADLRTVVPRIELYRR